MKRLGNFVDRTVRNQLCGSFSVAKCWVIQNCVLHISGRTWRNREDCESDAFFIEWWYGDWEWDCLWDGVADGPGEPRVSSVMWQTHKKGGM